MSAERSFAHTLAQLIGKLSAAVMAIQLAALHYQGLQYLKHQAMAQKGYDDLVSISNKAREHLSWWVQNLEEQNNRTLRDPSPQMVTGKDASLLWHTSCT